MLRRLLLHSMLAVVAFATSARARAEGEGPDAPSTPAEGEAPDAPSAPAEGEHADADASHDDSGEPPPAARSSPARPSGRAPSDDASDHEVDPRAPSARATADLPAPARNLLDPTAAGTSIPIEGRPQSGETLRDVLVEAPGARVLSTGALGQFNAVSLRGTELGQTSVMLDDLPLGGPEVGPIDLSLFPTVAFSSIEVYRGGAPAYLSDSSIGGVVRLVPRSTFTTYLRPSADAGAFGTYRGALEAGVAEGPLRLVTSGSLLASRQDFRFRNENGTLYDPSDDFWDRQRNANVVQHHLFTSARVNVGRSRFDLVYLGLGRSGGFPGAGLRRTNYASQDIAQNVASAAYSYDRMLGERRLRVQARLGANGYRNRFVDPYGGVGLGPANTDDRTRVLSGRVATTIDLTRFLEGTVVGTVRGDRVDRTDHAALYDEPPATRFVYASTAELRAHGRIGATDVELRPSFQAQRNVLESSILGNFGAVDHHRDARTLFTGRVGMMISPLRTVSFQASFHRGVRAPSLLELFGNRSTVAANPSLRAETGIGGDLGAVVRLSRDHYCLVGEARTFLQTIDDVIVLIPTSQYQARAQNQPRATLVGFESSAHATFGRHLDAVVQWNATRSRDAQGYQLTNRPVHNAYARLTGALGPRGTVLSDVRVYVDVTTVSRTYLAPKELKQMPTRTWLGFGVEVALLDDSLRASFSMRDATNVGGTDFLGYPLSGRSYSGTVSYRKEFQ